MSKNVHLIPTTKESNLAIIDGRLLQYDPQVRFLSGMGVDGINIENQFIYITNDERVVRGITVYDNYRKEVLQALDSDNTNFFNLTPTRYRKVVLTNDPSLIADGVQEIQQSFLSFFAENPVDCVRVTKMLQTRWGTEWQDLPDQTEGREPESIYRTIYKLEYQPKTEIVKLLNEFEILEGIPPIGFDEKDWARFERFVKNKTEERELEYSSGFKGYRNKYSNECIYEDDYFKLFSAENKKYTKKYLFQATLEALNLGMQIRQEQLQGFAGKSGKELHKEWFEKMHYKTQ